jgi:hypothetical protein
VGRTNYVLKSLQFKTICPTQACTKPSREVIEVGLDPQQPYSPAAPLTRPPGLDPEGPTFPSPRKLVAEGLDPTEVGTQT